MLHFDGRLYLFETVSELGDEFEDDEASTTVTAEMKAEIKAERDSVDKRVFALSLQGETLQTGAYRSYFGRSSDLQYVHPVQWPWASGPNTHS